MKYALFSDPGDRAVNEDAVGHACSGDSECFVVCDGLGGHAKGEVASRIASETALERFRALADSHAGTEAILMDAFLESQDRVMLHQESDRETKGMKTTMVMLVKADGCFQWGHVGDSRLYRFVSGRLQERTSDHSVPQILVSCGQLKEEEIRFHPDRNRLLRAIGTVWDSPRCELGDPVEAGEDEAYLLCTDGFWEWVTEKEMEQALSVSDTPEAWISKMLESIPEKGSGKKLDNFTAAAVFTGPGQL